jgi:hypothetical protein
MSRFIQQAKEKPVNKKTERKIPLSQPGSKNFNQKALETAKPVYGQSKI